LNKNSWAGAYPLLPFRRTTTADPPEIDRGFYPALGRGGVSAVLATLHGEIEWIGAEGFSYSSASRCAPQEVLHKLLVPLARDCAPT